MLIVYFLKSKLFSEGKLASLAIKSRVSSVILCSVMVQCTLKLMIGQCSHLISGLAPKIKTHCHRRTLTQMMLFSAAGLVHFIAPCPINVFFLAFPAPSELRKRHMKSLLHVLLSILKYSYRQAKNRHSW